ncbi:hypothetical protein SGPA1_50243 [Streptomyces misionensis JCM 4497]
MDARAGRRTGGDRHVRPRPGPEGAVLPQRLVLRCELPVHEGLLLGHPAPLPGPRLRRPPRALFRQAPGRPLRRHGLPRIPGADRGVHAGGLLADPAQRQHPGPGAVVLVRQRRHADGLHGRPRRLRGPHPPAAPLGRPAGRPGARRGADRHHQLGPAGGGADGRRDADVGPPPPGRLRRPPGARHGRQALSRVPARAPARAVLAGRQMAGVRAGRGRRGGRLAGGEPAGDAVRLPGLVEVLHVQPGPGRRLRLLLADLVPELQQPARHRLREHRGDGAGGAVRPRHRRAHLHRPAPAALRPAGLPDRRGLRPHQQGLLAAVRALAGAAGGPRPAEVAGLPDLAGVRGGVLPRHLDVPRVHDQRRRPQGPADARLPLGDRAAPAGHPVPVRRRRARHPDAGTGRGAPVRGRRPLGRGARRGGRRLRPRRGGPPAPARHPSRGAAGGLGQAGPRTPPGRFALSERFPRA